MDEPSTRWSRVRRTRRHQPPPASSKVTQVAALLRCFPYMGIFLALNAIRVVQEVPDQTAT